MLPYRDVGQCDDDAFASSNGLRLLMAAICFSLWAGLSLCISLRPVEAPCGLVCVQIRFTLDLKYLYIYLYTL